MAILASVGPFRPKIGSCERSLRLTQIAIRDVIFAYMGVCARLRVLSADKTLHHSIMQWSPRNGFDHSDVHSIAHISSQKCELKTPDHTSVLH